MKDRRRPGLPSGPFESPRPGDHGTGLRSAREGPGGGQSSKFDSGLRQRAPFAGKTRPRSSNRVVRARTRRGLVRMERKAASWNRLVELLQAAQLNRRIISGARAVRARERVRYEVTTSPKTNSRQPRLPSNYHGCRVTTHSQLPPGAVANKNDTSDDAASRKTLGALQRRPKTDAARSSPGGSRKKRHAAWTRHDAAAAGARGGRA
ncbi:hypothetical protein THAOC_31609 [Thalassiosira oceanica]|uniref:Uncharacterized protein n=1 Tax=Thalassiosira oceanica TaxID=159749 RepID=K0RB11_THAOC|nr:hypothetical protein THAOC_31609 [Thalassiosira oceanica]|eukprot:EJK49509.1 hypothetical protein THAOC_31609 [Thalassiosira oceanica]